MSISFDHELAFLKALQGETQDLENLSLSDDFISRLDIYKTSVISTLQNALYKNFKPLETLLGKEAFQELCYRYAQDHLSTTLNLSRYGADLHEFIKTAPFAAALPYLADFVEFCFLWQQTYLRCDSGVSLIQSEYPLYEIWQRCQPEFQGTVVIDNWQGPFYYTIYRQEERVVVERAFY